MEKKIAHDLLSIGAVFFRPDEPFTWASGIKHRIFTQASILFSEIIMQSIPASIAAITAISGGYPLSASAPIKISSEKIIPL